MIMCGFWAEARRVSGGVCVVLAVMLMLVAPAACALGQRGHVPGFSFGGAGAGAGQFRFENASLKTQEAAGIAVSEATGDVYVVDRGNDRVQQFRPKLGADGELVGEEFVAVWGWGVSDGKAEYEVCTSACREGVGGMGKGELKEAGPVAVDNSPGGAETVFVGANASAKRPDVQRYAPDGEKALGKLPVEEEGALDGLATDLQGHVWVYRGEEEGEGVIEGFTDASPPVLVEPVLESVIACAKPGFGVDAAGEDFYVDHELLTGEEECPAVIEREKAKEKEPAEGVYARPALTAEVNAAELLGGVTSPLIGELDRENTGAVAVDQASSEASPLGATAKGDVYVDNGSVINVFGSQGALVQTLGAGELQDGMGVAVDSRTGDVFAIDGASDTVQVFVPEPAARPVVEDLSAQNVTPSEVQVSALIDPKGSDTHYYFQYGTVDCVSDPQGCTDLPAAPGTDIGSGFGAQAVSVTLSTCARGRATSTGCSRATAGSGRRRAGPADVSDAAELTGVVGGWSCVGAGLTGGKGWGEHRTALTGRRADPSLPGRGSRRIHRERAGGARTGWESCA